MDYQVVRHSFQKLACAAWLVVCFFLVEAASAERWDALTSFRAGRAFLGEGADLVVATSGGLMTISDPSGAAEQLTHLDGLGTTRLYDLTTDNQNRVWVAASGRLIRRNSTGFTQYLFRNQDNQLFDCFSLAEDADLTWVGTSQGVVLFDKVTDDGQIADSYELFGNLNPAPVVNDIALQGDSIWIATLAGLAVADKRVPLLLNGPSSWQSFNLGTNPELVTDSMTTIAVIDSFVYTGSSRGLFRLDRSDVDTVFAAFPQLTGWRVYRLERASDSIFVCAANGLWLLHANQLTVVPTPGYAGPVSATRVVAGRRWIATPASGIWYEEGGTYREFLDYNLPQNDAVDIAIRSDRTLGILFRFQGTAIQSAASVTGWDTVAVAPFTRHVALIADSTNNFWIGTFGNGVFRLSDTVASQYDSTNSPLRGNTDGGNNNFVVSQSLATDGTYLLAPAYRSFTGNPICFAPLASIDNPSAWGQYGFADGIGDAFVNSVALRDNYFAAGTDANGCILCHIGGSLLSKSDDTGCVQLRDAGNNLRSDAVTVVRFSPSGELWVGTNFGVSRLDPTIENRFTDINLPAGFGPLITDMEFDTQGSLWLSSINGLVRFDGVTGQFTQYTAQTSGLISDNITQLTVDRFTNDLYCATSDGVSILRSQIGEPTADPNQVLAFPNPFVISSSADQVEFNFAGSGEIDIFSLAGEHVFHSKQLRWDGRNQNGEDVSSGVYLFVITSQSGERGRGKVVLIRR